MESEAIKKIVDYYNPQVKDDNLYLYTEQSPQGKRIPFNGEEFYLLFGETAANPTEAIAKGAVVTTCKELYRAFADDDTYNRLQRHYEPDERTKKFLDGIREELGLIETRDGYDEYLPEEDVELTYNIWLNASEVQVGQVNGQWVAQHSIAHGDDYNISGYFYSKKPAEKDIETTRLLWDIEFYFKLNGWDKGTFRCWECGIENNWMDIPGTLQDKWYHFTEKYCGC